MKALLPLLCPVLALSACRGLSPSDEATEEGRFRSLSSIQKYDREQRSRFDGAEQRKQPSHLGGTSLDKKSYDTGGEHRFTAQEARTGSFSGAEDASSYSGLTSRLSRQEASVPDSRWSREDRSRWSGSAHGDAARRARESGGRYDTSMIGEYQRARKTADAPPVIQRQALEEQLTPDDVRRLLGKE